MDTPSFKDLLMRDVDEVFMNPEEFADNTHTIDGKTMTVMFDEMENIEREKKMKSHMDGVYARQILIYVKASEFGSLPAFGHLLRLDNRQYKVVDAVDEGGVYTITLEANRSTR